MSPFHQHPLIRNIAKVGAGNVIGNAMNFIALYLLSVELGPAAFGVFSALQMSMLLLAQLADGGLSTSIIKTYRELHDAGRPQAAEALLRRTFWLRMAVIGILGVVVYALAEPLNRHWLQTEGGADMIRWIVLGALGSSLWMFVQSAMQARQQFARYAVLTFANHALRLALFAFLIFAGQMTVPRSVVIFAAVPFFGSLMAGLLFPRQFWTSKSPIHETAVEFQEMLRLSRWIFLSFMIVSLLSRMDVIMLTALRPDNIETGYYNFANIVAQAYPIIGASISTVLLPKISTTRRREDMKLLAGGLLKFAPIACLATVALIVLGHLLIPLVKGGEYSQSAVVLDLLAIGLTLAVIINPLSFFCLSFERAQWLTYLNVGQLLINLALNWLLIPHFGAVAAAGATLATQIFGFICVLSAFFWLLKNAGTD